MLKEFPRISAVIWEISQAILTPPTTFRLILHAIFYMLPNFVGNTFPIIIFRLPLFSLCWDITSNFRSNPKNPWRHQHADKLKFHFKLLHHSFALSRWDWNINAVMEIAMFDVFKVISSILNLIFTFRARRSVFKAAEGCKQLSHYFPSRRENSARILYYTRQCLISAFFFTEILRQMRTCACFRCAASLRP